jgi:CheY-like chemotaxis protein
VSTSPTSVDADILDGKRVLIVEDEALIAMLAEEMVAELGCVHHATAPSVAKALAVVEAGGFDLALLDVNVARERVFPVADALEAKGIPFAFASGYGEGDLPEAYKAHSLLSKPYSTAQLRGALLLALTRIGR